MKRIFVFIFCTTIFNSAFAQTGFYNLDSIQKIEITFTQSNWRYQLDTSYYGADGFVMAVQVKVNGVTYDSCGVRFKGHSSFDTTKTKNPFHIKLNYTKQSSNYEGYTDVKLANEYSDPTWVREVLGYEVLRNYMHAPLSNFAQVYVNGVYFGVYTSDESIDSHFLNDHFNSSNGSFFKANPINVVSGHLPTLTYMGSDSAYYYDSYEIQSKKTWKDLINLCDTITNNFSSIEKNFDIDKGLWMLAFNNVAVNLDSYSGLFAQNYYLYNDNNNRMLPIVWDLNMCFGGFNNTGLSTLSPSAMENLTPLLHATNPSRPLIQGALANARYQKMYIAHMRTMNNEFFVNNKFDTIARHLQSLIDTAVQHETYGLYSYSQFQNGMSTNYAGGTGTVPALDSLMQKRAAYLQTTTQFQYTPPTISNIVNSPSIVSFGDTIWITATIANANYAYVGNRNSSTKIFTKTEMFDDGLHHDGAANDGVFGGNFVATSLLMQYYIYAENGSAGMFAPQRAEYEFYNINVIIPTAQKGDVVINEVLSSNSHYGQNESGSYADWFELYNTTSTPLNLNGLYFSNSAANLTKSSIPSGWVIEPKSYLVVFADNNSSTSQYIHTNFKISKSGDRVIFGSASTVFDSIAFGVQTTDISYGRCPDGSSNLKTMTPSFDAANCGMTGISAINNISSFVVFPNPASQSLVISFQSSVNSISIFDLVGRKILEQQIVNRNSEIVNISSLQNGIYFIKATDENGNHFTSKFVKQ
jgi:CotH kinase protein/Secretion system C-terminal sorting domain/Lamin Tail Domain